MPDQTGGSTPVVHSVSHAIAMMRLLAGAPEAMGVTAIARRLGLSPSSCFNISRTLVDEGILNFDPETKRYSLGPGAMILANQSAMRDRVVLATRPLLEILATEFDGAAGVWRLIGANRAILLDVRESESATRIHMSPGQRQPAAAGAVGRALMAATTPGRDTLRKLFGAVRWRRPMTFKGYESDLDKARSRGYAIDEGHLISGITTVAASLSDGRDNYAVSLSTFSGRYGDEDLHVVAQRLAAGLEEVRSRLIG